MSVDVPKYGIASPHAAATEAGASVFAVGGNAIDAAIAACAALAVVYPHMCTIGGDLFALAQAPDGRAHGFNASGAAPMALQADDLRRRYGGMPIIGPDAITVPGVLAGWGSLAEWGGRLALSEVLQPALRLAAEGCEVAPSLAASLAENSELLARDEGMTDIFARDGRWLRVGEHFCQPALAESLGQVASSGPGVFYHGELGERYVRGLRRLDCPITTDDLAQHSTTPETPIADVVRGWEVLTLPPNSQGYALLQLLRLVDDLGLDPDPLGPDADVLARLFYEVSQDRDRHLADPRAMTVSIDELLSEPHLRQLAARAIDFRAAASEGRAASVARPSGDTIAVVVADADGWGVSIIQSVFHAFGAAVLEPSTGIIAQNRGSCFTLDPDSPNVAAGGKRSLHTLMPVLVRRHGQLRIVAGTMGGKAQPQIHTQILGRLLWDRERLQEALVAPRWIVENPDGGPTEAVYAEASALSASPALDATGMQTHALPDLSEKVGHAQYVEISRAGWISAVSDPRSDGLALRG